MNPHVHLCLVLHNHQPIGNFDGVFEQSYQDSYLPFLDVFEPYDKLQISLHTSGPLMMWLAERHPEYIDRLRILVEADRVEVVGGPQYEPILTMLPPRELVFALARKGIGFEAMDTPAACRTFNILIGEDRDVAAVLLIEDGA